MTDNRSKNLLLAVGFTEKERELFLVRASELLRYEAQKSLGPENTSMPVEKAQELLRSILFTLRVALDGGWDKDKLLTGDPAGALAYGREILQQKCKTVRVERKLLHAELPPVQNTYYRESVRNLGIFFLRYEVLYAAHAVPCTLDYWLLRPVPEEKEGILFLEDYIRRLQIENDFVNCFAPKLVAALYGRMYGQYEKTFFNLCESVFTNALGLALLGRDARALNVSPLLRSRLLASLYCLSEDEVRQALSEAAAKLLASLGLTADAENIYWAQVAEDTAGRVFAAAQSRDLSRVFVTFTA